MITEIKIPQIMPNSDNLAEIESWFKKHVKSNFSANNDIKMITAALQKLTHLNRANSLSDSVNVSLGYTVLHQVAKLGFDRFIENCAENHQQTFKEMLNQPSKMGNTPLHLATLEGHADTVEVLLETGANPNSENENKMTPLIFAASKISTDLNNQKARIDIFKLLLPITDNSKLTALDYLEMPLLLNLTKLPGVDLVKLVLEKCPELLFVSDKRNQNIIHHAVLNKNKELINYLSTETSLLAQLTNNRSTALILACRYGTPEIIETLLNHQVCKQPDYLAIEDEHGKKAFDYLEEKRGDLKDKNAQDEYQYLIDRISQITPSIAIQKSARPAL